MAAKKKTAKKKPAKKKPGRKEWKPTQAQLDRVGELASVYASDAEIYRMLGIGKDTFYKYKDVYFSEIIANNRMKTTTAAKAAMVHLALNKKVFPAIQSILKAQANWDESGLNGEPEDRDFNLKLID